MKRLSGIWTEQGLINMRYVSLITHPSRVANHWQVQVHYQPFDTNGADVAVALLCAAHEPIEEPYRLLQRLYEGQVAVIGFIPVTLSKRPEATQVFGDLNNWGV